MQMNKLSILILCTIVAISSIGCGTREWPPTDEEVSASVSDNDNSDSESEQDISNSETVTTTAKTTTKAVTSTTTKISTTTLTTTTTVNTTVAETTTTTTSTSNGASQADGISFSITQTNSWESDGKTVHQFECIINNITANAITVWNIEMPVGDASLLQGWSANYNISDGVLIASPDEYNTEIAASGTFSLGFQLSTNTAIDTSQAILNANGASISPMQ